MDAVSIRIRKDCIVARAGHNTFTVVPARDVARAAVEGQGGEEEPACGFTKCRVCRARVAAVSNNLGLRPIGDGHRSGVSVVRDGEIGWQTRQIERVN